MDLYRRNMSTFGAKVRMWPTSDPYMTRRVSVRTITPRGHTTQPDCASASATGWFRGGYDTDTSRATPGPAVSFRRPGLQHTPFAATWYMGEL